MLLKFRVIITERREALSTNVTNIVSFESQHPALGESLIKSVATREIVKTKYFREDEKVISCPRIQNDNFL